MIDLSLIEATLLDIYKFYQQNSFDFDLKEIIFYEEKSRFI
jgi:hypothetical protein